MAEFSIMCKFKAEREVKLFSDELQDAMISARALSANFDIGFSSVYKIKSTEEGIAHVVLCQFHHGLMYKLFPAGEGLIKALKDF